MRACLTSSQAEYLPLPVLRSQTADGTSELISNMLLSVLPNIPGAKTVAVAVSDAQWEEVLWSPEDEVEAKVDEDEDEDDEEEVFVVGDDGLGRQTKGDWVGVDRDRRSAFLIVGALRSESIL